MMVLETFNCRVDRIDGDTAYITLKSELNGDELWGEYSSSKLAEKNIFEGDRFSCAVVENNEEIDMELSLIPPRVLTKEEQDAIRKRIEEQLGDI